MFVLSPLRGLLRYSGAVVHVLADIGSVVELARSVLDTVPDLTGRGGSALGTDKRIDVGLQLTKGILHMGALAKAGTHEGGVEREQNPGSALEEDGSQEQTDPQEDLESGHDGHRHIVVGLDKVSNSLGDGVYLLGTRRAACRDWLGRLNGGDQVGTSVGRDVEDRVNSVREQSKGVLGRQKPNQRHG